MFISRQASGLIKNYFNYFPLVCVTGPRQSGKTTLLRKMFPDWHYYSLEDPDHLLLFTSDPKGFLNHIKAGAVLDEVQRAPELISYLQGIVDEPGFNGKFVISGSQNFLLLKKVTQTLAGRAGIVNLLPFSYSEIKPHFSHDVNTRILNGFYPRVLTHNIPPGLFYPDYIQTFLERDILNIKSITDKTSFYRFMKLCAGRCGQLLNYSQLAVDCGISVNTAKAWISLLESSFIVMLLPPFYANISKQLVKSPKLFFYDTGLVSHLLQINDSEQLQIHPNYGALFENMVVAEMMKMSALTVSSVKNYFLRDKTGHEIDLLVTGKKTSFVEIKSGRTIKEEYLKNLIYYSDKIKQDQKFVFYQGEKKLEIRNVRIEPWTEIDNLEW